MDDIFSQLYFLWSTLCVCVCVRGKNATVLEIKGGIEVIFSCAKFGRYLSTFLMFLIFLLKNRHQVFSEVVAAGATPRSVYIGGLLICLNASFVSLVFVGSLK